jgi:isocitrate dehydrogenase (NAD+)
MHRATLIPGDGIGPEVVDAARRAIEATGVEIAWDVEVAGSQALRTTGTALP